jgi:hypothetical protein
MKWYAKCDKCGTVEVGAREVDSTLIIDGPLMPSGWLRVDLWRQAGGPGNGTAHEWSICGRCASDVIPQVERLCRPERREPE